MLWDRALLVLSTWAVTYADWGKTSEAQALHREIVARAAREYAPRTFLAMSAAAAGEQDLAIALARQAEEAREPVFLALARNFPGFRRVREDPRFPDILRRLKLPGIDD